MELEDEHLARKQPAGDDKLIHKVAIYIRVYLRFSKYPENQTYAEATKRLQQRVIELKEKNFPHNRIAQHLRMPFRTLKDILTRELEPIGRRNHCPWNLLERLENAENEIICGNENQPLAGHPGRPSGAMDRRGVGGGTGRSERSRRKNIRDSRWRDEAAMERKRVRMTRVIDGDTVEVVTGGGLFRQPRKERVRLYGIDAPEMSQAGGEKSAEHLQRLIGSNRKMWMDTVAIDQYGRTVGLIHRRKNKPGDSYNYMMVRDGQARSYMARVQDREKFRAAEDLAARRGWGIWKKRDATAPWEYRQAQRRKKGKQGKLKLVVTLFLAGALVATAAYLAFNLGVAVLP